jgi:hypothetical protein
MAVHQVYVLEAIPKIGDFETAIVMHNDAVVQGMERSAFHA